MPARVDPGPLKTGVLVEIACDADGSELLDAPLGAVARNGFPLYATLDEEPSNLRVRARRGRWPP
ncbi:hypothetical protein ABZ747_12230 [Kitasatospora cineracea]|uniref:hypothetical protein n=1 Tax=Kitasatospora cineracea TaxID=88074 RepID=UPI0033F18280